MTTQAEMNFQAFGDAGERPIWYHGKTTRLAVEQMLKGKPDGTFTIRDSSSSAGDFVLSMSEGVRVSHYIIQRSGPHSFVLSDKTFMNLVQLINFYRIHLLDSSCLTVPLPEKEALRNGVKINHFLVTVVAKHNFNGRDPEDLSFHKGELLNVVEKHEPQWWKAQSQETLMVGVVPSNYVDQYALGPIEIAKNEAAEAAKQRAQMEAKKAAAPPPVVRRAKPTGPSEEELRKQRAAAEKAERERLAAERAERERIEHEKWQRAEQERIEAAERDRAKAAAAQKEEIEAMKAQKAAAEKEVEAVRQRLAATAAARPKFIMARATLDRAANTFDKSALTFKEGDMIHVKKQNENGLWEGSVLDGRRKGRRGHFPFTFVELMDSSSFDADVKALEKEFQVAQLKAAGFDVEKLLKKGENLPPVMPRAPRKAPPAAAPLPEEIPDMVYEDPSLAPSSAPPPIAARGKPAPPLPASRGAAPPLPPPNSRSRAPLPPDPQELYIDADSDYDEDDIYGGLAEAFDDNLLGAAMDEIYGTVN